MKSPKYTDLVALEALYRPGPMEMIPEFIRRHNAGRFTCPLKGIADILGETYGLVVYQEQLMQIVKRVAGFTPVQADTLRKAVCKRKAEVLSEMRELFLAGGMERGYGKTSFERFWNRYAIGPRAYWVFCKAHAECYTLLGYRCGYLKAHSAKQQTDSADF
jgi:DNA polymerase III, alpha subunit